MRKEENACLSDSEFAFLAAVNKINYRISW
jgi:hypothetical protein